MRTRRAQAGVLAGCIALATAITVLVGRDGGEPAGAVEVAMARVTSVVPLSPLAAIRRAGRLALTPAIEVVLQVAPAEGGDSVLVNDVLDSGSVIGLAAGAIEQVFYPEDHPADARMVRGTRSGVANGWGLLAGALAAAFTIIAGRPLAMHPKPNPPARQ